MQEAAIECQKGRRPVSGGDYNYDLNFDGQNLNVTGNPSVTVIRAQDLSGKFVKTHKKGAVIDFVIASQDLAIVAVPTSAYTKWSTIDHSPVVVKIG